MKTETHHEKPLGSSDSALFGALDRVACTVDPTGSDFIVAAASENAVLSEPGLLTPRTGQEFVTIIIDPKDQAAAQDVLDVGHDRRFKSTVEEQAMHSQRLVDLGYLE